MTGPPPAESEPEKPPAAAAEYALASVLPRVLIVSRRTVRKNKFVDFVGEYHLDLIVKYGAVPLIVPRVSGLDLLLDSFEPIYGVLLCEGEDVDPSLYEDDSLDLTMEKLEEVRKLHSSDCSIDKDKDSIELQLARRCLERNIPCLGICRGSQILNVACGGSLYQDVETEMMQKGGVPVKHVNYDDYDRHRHPIKIVEDTPLHHWFKDSLDESMDLNVNSYHHQGVKRLAARFKPMAFSPCGLIEAFYDPDVYNPDEGKFIVGLQFHPERMVHEQPARTNGDDSTHLTSESTFDYPGCPCTYQEFVKAVVAYHKKLLGLRLEKSKAKFDGAMEEQQLKIIRSFCLAKHLYEEQLSMRRNRSMHDGMQALKAIQSFQQDSDQMLDLEEGSAFLQSTKAELNSQQANTLKQVGATVRNSSVFLKRVGVLKDREVKAKKLLERLSTNELHDVSDFYKMMVSTTLSVLENRQSRRTLNTVTMAMRVQNARLHSQGEQCRALNNSRHVLLVNGGLHVTLHLHF